MRIAIFLVCIVLLSGCSGLGGGLFGGSENAPVTGLRYEDVHSGVEGVRMDILPERPQAIYIVPNEEGRDIVFALSLDNRGAHDITDGIVALNYDSQYVLMEESHKSFSLFGRSFELPKGEKQDMFFLGTIPPLTVAQKQTAIEAIACYAYGTEFQFDVCIDTDPANVYPVKKACDVLENQKKYGALSGQGGPIAISKLDQTVKKIDDNTLKIQFIISLRNQGTGNVYLPSVSPAQLCLGGGDTGAVNWVEVKAWLAGEKIECDTPVKVAKGEEGLSVCTVEGLSVPVNTASFPSSLKVELDYAYVDSAGKSINLRKLGAKI